jgi:hypothetical protein
MLVPLYDIWNFAAKGIVLTPLNVFTFLIDPNFETKNNFKTRSNRFGYEFLPYLLKAKNERIKEMESNPDEFKEKDISFMKTQLIKLEKAYEKHKKKYGD